MDVDSPQWPEWEAQFMELAEQAPLTPASKGEIKGAQHYLCLGSNNGLSPQEEFAELERMAQQKEKLKKVEIDTSFWQDMVLYIP